MEDDIIAPRILTGVILNSGAAEQGAVICRTVFPPSMRIHHSPGANTPRLSVVKPSCWRMTLADDADEIGLRHGRFIPLLKLRCEVADFNLERTASSSSSLSTTSLTSPRSNRKHSSRWLPGSDFHMSCTSDIYVGLISTTETLPCLAASAPNPLRKTTPARRRGCLWLFRRMVPDLLGQSPILIPVAPFSLFNNPTKRGLSETVA